MIRMSALMAVLCAAASAQPLPSFEAATVRPAAPATGGGRPTSGDRVIYSNTTRLNVLVRAFEYGLIGAFVTLMLRAPVFNKTGPRRALRFPLELTLEETGGATAAQADERAAAPSASNWSLTRLRSTL
jgi:hypothetical protein